MANKSVRPVFFAYHCFCLFDCLNHLTQFRLLMDLVHMSQLNQPSYFLSFVLSDCFRRLQFFSLTILPLKLFKLVMLLMRWNPNPRLYYHLSYLRVEPLKLDCAVCVVKPIKIVMLFIWLSHISKFDHLNYFKQLTNIMHSVQLR